MALGRSHRSILHARTDQRFRTDTAATGRRAAPPRIRLAFALASLVATTLAWTPSAALAASGIDIEVSVGHAITGSIVGPDQLPIANVNLDACETTAGPNDECAGTQTDETGAFSLDGLKAAGWIVRIAPPEFEDDNGMIPDVAGGWYRDGGITPDRSLATVVTTSGGSVSIDVQLPAGGHVGGIITSADGPVADVTVSACLVDEGNCYGATTDASGAYDIPALEPATYIVTVEVYGPDLRSGWVAGGSIVADQLDADIVALGLGSTATVDVQLPAGRHISGVVTGPEGPLEGAEVSACLRPDGWPCQTTSTGPDGAYVVTGLGATSYGVRVIDQNGLLPTAFFTTGEVTPNWSGATPVDVSAGDATGIDLDIPHGATFRGIVTNPASLGGGPIEWASVQACAMTCNDASFYAETDASGAYVIGPLLPGPYLVSVSASGDFLGGYFDATSGLVELEADADTVAVTSGAETTVDLQFLEAGSITGTITGGDGAPIVAGDSLSACQGDRCVWANGEEGSFSINGLGSGDYVLRYESSSGSAHLGGWFGANGFARTRSLAGQIVIDGAEDVPVDIVVPVGESIAGTVTGEGHGALASARVLACASADECQVGDTAEDGTYSISGLWPDEYLVRVLADRDLLGGIFLPGWYSTGGTVTDEALATPVVVGEIPGGDGNTQPGTSVIVTPTDTATGRRPVSLTFATVTAGGETSLTIGPDGPFIPTAYALGDPPTYLHVGTTAGFTGAVEVCVDYGFLPRQGDEAFLRLLRVDFDSSADVTTSLDTEADRVCGSSTSLGTFVVATKLYAYLGYLPPIARPPALNSAKAGSTVDLRFSLTGNQGLAILAEDSPLTFQVDCTTHERLGLRNVPDTRLRYQTGADRYVVSWRTEKAWAGQCREFVLTLRDGSEHTALFRFAP